jgi:sugar phosphate isomerase/epimerase
LAGVPRELATDADRILPGDGDFQLEPIMRILREIGYAGWISVECLNPLFWQMKPAQVAQTGYSALQRILEK